MKNFIKKFLIFGAILAAVSTTFALVPSHPTYADDDNTTKCRHLLGLVSWDCGTVEEVTNEDELTATIWKIAANVLKDLGVIAAYLVLGYVIYGGYLYMLSSGDTGKVANGKKTLTHAFIGLAIVLLANVILDAIRIALIGNQAFSPDAGSDSIFTNAIQWVIGISGLVSVIFIVIGGFGYMTSGGDPNKLQKAKSTIMYALIGLAIVGLAEIIVSFVAKTITGDNSTEEPTSYIEQTISKGLL